MSMPSARRKNRYAVPMRYAAVVLIIAVLSFSSASSHRSDDPFVPMLPWDYPDAFAAPDIAFTWIPDPTPSVPARTPVPFLATPVAPSPTPTPIPTPTPLASTVPAPGAEIVATDQGETLGIVIERLQRDGKTYFIADIRVKEGSQIRNGFAGGQFGANKREHTSVIAQRYEDCVFAINGDFYNFHTQGVVLRDGVIYRDASRRENVDLLLIDQEGLMSTVKEEDAEADSLLADGTVNVYSFGPVLVADGIATEIVNRRGRYNEPRCGIGMYEPGHYLAILCDGRRDGWSEGCTFKELAELFIERDVSFAYNMDGGGSATMVLSGETVNRPSNGQRSISDILYFSR